MRLSSNTHAGTSQCHASPAPIARADGDARVSDKYEEERGRNEREGEAATRDESDFAKDKLGRRGEKEAASVGRAGAAPLHTPLASRFIGRPSLGGGRISTRPPPPLT